MTNRIGACVVLLGFLAVAGMAAQVVPLAVSPGSERGVAVVGQACPTFSWTAVDWAAGYRVAVFEAIGVQIPSYEDMAAGVVPVLSKEIGGRALSWTPSTEEQLIAGNLYVWYVQAADASGQGTWSKGRLFIVETGMLAAGIEGQLRKTLEEKGVRPDVISDVLKEMKSEGQGVLSGKMDSKPQGKVGALGSEGVNTLYGNLAGASITTGLSDTFIGNRSGYANTTGTYNTFLGYYAGWANTTGNHNTFLGYQAGLSNTTGINNTCLGSYAGLYTTTGTTNVFLGFCSGLFNTTGNSNTFLGPFAGYANTTGSNNNFIGFNAGPANSTGYDNTFLGYSAGANNTTGLSNIFLGNFSGHANTTGNFNTVLGYAAGYYSTGGGNVFLGSNAGYSETGSNKLYISNSSTSAPLIYGDFSSGILGVNGWLGVGTQTPAYPMEVKTTGRNSVLVVQRDGGALNFMNASTAYGQFGTGNAYPVRILVNSAWRMSLNLDNSLTLVNGASCTAGGVWTDASSRELKENIEDLSAAEAENALRELVPVKYNYKADKEERHVGFIAEDVPGLVASKDRKTMSPMNVVGVLTKVLQELDRKAEEQQQIIQEQQKINLEQHKINLEQQKTIADLKAQIEEMKKRGK